MSSEKAFEALNKILESAQRIATELEIANNLSSTKINVARNICVELKGIKEEIERFEFE
jgi:hypothetical protein